MVAITPKYQIAQDPREETRFSLSKSKVFGRNPLGAGPELEKK
jgi:hypothetical protein